VCKKELQQSYFVPFTGTLKPPYEQLHLQASVLTARHKRFFSASFFHSGLIHSSIQQAITMQSTAQEREQPKALLSSSCPAFEVKPPVPNRTAASPSALCSHTALYSQGAHFALLSCKSELYLSYLN